MTNGGRTSGALIERVRAGDADAFDELVRQRIDGVYRTALGILGNPVDARDATQDALVSAWRSLRTLHDPERFDAWLHRVTVNAARMVARKRRSIREIQIPPDADRPPRSAASAVVSGDFDRAFDRLSVEQRDLLLEHHLDGKSIGELARDLEIPEGTVKSRLHTARQALESQIRDMNQ